DDVLAWDNTANEWTCTAVGGVGAGDITAVGDVTSGAAFDGTQGTQLIFNDSDGDGTLTIANLSALRTWTLPDTTGTLITTGDNGTVTGTMIANDTVVLATDTTGNYVATMADAGNGNITVAGSGSENAGVTLDITADALDFTEFQDTLDLDAAL